MPHGGKLAKGSRSFPPWGRCIEGHLSLVALAKSKADRVVASIFVNPIQFGPREDFHRYPRDETGDLAKLEKAGTDLVFAPDTAEMYPEGFSTKVSVGDLTEDLCGAARPNHFDGVATVVTKLLLQCAPDLAVFGEKDYQQLLVIKRLVSDLDIPVEIIGGPIVREEDGLALSSRNAYLSPAERKTAPLLYQTISAVAADLSQRPRRRRRRPCRTFQARGGGLPRRLCRRARPRDVETAVGPGEAGARAGRGPISAGRGSSTTSPCRCLPIDEAKLAQILAHRARHLLGPVVETLGVRRRVGRFEIAPALEGAARMRPRGDKLGVKHDAATARAVVLHIGPEIEHALPHQHEALDHPIERAAVEQLGAPPRRLQGAMADARASFPPAPGA